MGTGLGSGHLIQQSKQKQAPSTVPRGMSVLQGALAAAVSCGLLKGLQACRRTHLEKLIHCQGPAQAAKVG